MKPILLDFPKAILTPRLLLRGPQPGDGPELNRAIHDSHEELRTWMPFARQLPTIEESEENVRRAHAKFCLREDLRYPFFDRATGRMLGSSGLHRIQWDIPCFEIAYWVRTGHHGQGLASEAANAMTRFAFGFLKARRVEIRCNATNHRSEAVMKRLNFKFDAKLEMTDHYVIEGQPRDTLVYSRLNTEGLPPLEVTW